MKIIPRIKSQKLIFVPNIMNSVKKNYIYICHMKKYNITYIDRFEKFPISEANLQKEVENFILILREGIGVGR